MLKSMTGFGKAVCDMGDKKITIEIKSLNSKQLDLNLKIQNGFREKEAELRNEIQRVLQRGKVDVILSQENLGIEKGTKINLSLAKDYYNQLSAFVGEMGHETKAEQLFQIIMRLPDVMKTEHNEIDEEEWTKVFGTFQKALDEVCQFRINEGKVLEEEVLGRIEKIRQLLMLVPQFEAERMVTIKTRIGQNLEDFSKSAQYDQNRFEQELIYYLEKIDITEEKVRLATHLDYFTETARKEDNPGKKLGFISQEIGREINTLGSKANHSEIQKLVVQMKDELEKIKEQTLNII
jgi:uncharacterized protein (TIGR00255 family)